MPHQPWDDAPQPSDDDRAGNPWFYAKTYLEFQKGLERLISELERHKKAIEALQLGT